MESSGDDGLGYGSLYFKLLKKLPEPLIRDYQRWIFDNQLKEVETPKDWLNQEAQFQMIAGETVHGLLHADHAQSSRSANNTWHRKEQTFVTTHSVQPQSSFCNSPHAILKCVEFQKLRHSCSLAVHQRKESVFFDVLDLHTFDNCAFYITDYYIKISRMLQLQWHHLTHQPTYSHRVNSISCLNSRSK